MLSGLRRDMLGMPTRFYPWRLISRPHRLHQGRFRGLGALRQGKSMGSDVIKGAVCGYPCFASWCAVPRGLAAGCVRWCVLLFALVVLLTAREEVRGQEMLNIEPTSFAPHETMAVGAAGHWWEVCLRVGVAPARRLAGELQLIVSRRVGPQLYSVRRSFVFQGPSRRTVRVPIFWASGRALNLQTTYRDATDRIIGSGMTVAPTAAPYVIAVVASEPGALFGLPGKMSTAQERRAVGGSAYITAMPMGSRTAFPFERTLVRRVRSVPLPHHPLCWSGISHVIWLDVAPSALTADQLESLRLWLYWGGTLVLSGGQHARAWGKGPFTQLLPATYGGSREIELDDASGGTTIRLAGRELVVRDRRAVLVLSRQGEPYAAECRIGHGRVVQVAFALTDPAFEQWSAQGPYWRRLLLGADPKQTGPSGVRIFARDLGKSTPEKIGALDVDGPCTELLLEHIYRACSSPRLWAARSTVALLVGGYLLLVAVAHIVAVRRRTAVNWSLLPLISVAYVLATMGYVARSKGGYAEVQLAEAFLDLPYVRRTAFVGMVSDRPGYVEIRATKRGVLLAPLDVLRSEVKGDVVFPGRLPELRLGPTALRLNVYPIVPRALLAEGYERCDTPLFATTPDGSSVRNNGSMELKDVVLVGNSRCVLLTRSWPTGETLTLAIDQPQTSGSVIGGLPSHWLCPVEGIADDVLYRAILELVHKDVVLPRPFVVAWSERTEPMVDLERIGRRALRRTIWCIFPGTVGEQVGTER